jgi:hypothetical protein
VINQRPFLLEALVGIDNNIFFSNNTSRQHVIFYHPQHEHVSFLSNNSSDKKWFILKIPFQSVHTIILFQTCFLTGYLKPISLNIIMFRPWGGFLTYSSINLPNLSIIFPNFFHNVLNVVQTTTFFNYGPLLMCVHTSHRPYGYPSFMLRLWQRTHIDP